LLLRRGAVVQPAGRPGSGRPRARARGIDLDQIANIAGLCIWNN